MDVLRGARDLISVETMSKTRGLFHRNALASLRGHGVTEGARRIGHRQHAGLCRKEELREKQQTSHEQGELSQKAFAERCTHMNSTMD